MFAVTDLQSVGLEEVFSDTHHLVIMLEGVSGRTLVEDDFSHKVGLLVSPLGNDALSFELLEDLGLCILRVSFKDFVDSVQT